MLPGDDTRSRGVSHGIGTSRTLMLLGALALLIGSAVVAFLAASDRDHRRLRDDLAHAASRQAQALDAYFDRAREINLLLAQNPVFATHEHGRQSREAGAALAYLERLYPGQISEACVIDVDGVETARVVDGHHAAPDELSTSEAENPFFAPTFAVGSGEVFQSTPYVSPDTNQWVISNSTPIVDQRGRKTAIVHFEVTLASFGRAMRATDPGLSTQIIDARSGRVILDSRSAQGVAMTPRGADAGGGPPADGDFTGDGTQYAVRTVGAAGGNANRWVVITSAPATAGFSFRTIGIESLLLMVAALALLAGAGLGFRADRRRLVHAAVTDPLSGLPNRLLFTDRTAHAIEAASRRDRQVAVALLDLDRFKEVNDALGHQAGDVLLQEVARRLQLAGGADVTVARLGGDEFALLFEAVSGPDEAARATRSILRALRDPVPVAEAQIGVTASAGLALWPDHGDSVDELLKRADIAMYRAKRTAGEVVTYRPEFDVHTPERLALTAELRTAIDCDEMTLVYQPKIELGSRRVTGVEALVRWNHPRLGLLPPGAFLSIVDELGLETALTRAVLHQALAQCRTWLDMGLLLQVAVNLPARLVQDPATVDLVTGALGRCGVPARHLRLEITETTFVGDTGRALEVLLRLEQTGVTLSIDDYGTGYSSLAYLKRLPVHELKIDRAFVTELADDTTDADIVRSTIDLGHRLGFTVVAEGVETTAAADLLAEAGCDTVQGFLYSHPLPPNEFVSWLGEWDLARSAPSVDLPDRISPSIAGSQT